MSTPLNEIIAEISWAYRRQSGGHCIGFFMEGAGTIESRLLIAANVAEINDCAECRRIMQDIRKLPVQDWGLLRWMMV